MKKLLFLLLICNVCKAQHYSRLDDNKYYYKKYKGHVKQIINSYYINFHFDSGKLKMNDTTQNAGYKINRYNKDSFNISGNIQKLTYTLIDTSKFLTTEFEYDNSNNLISKLDRDSNNLVSRHFIFKYNNGRLESVDEYFKKKFKSETVYFYNNKGVLKKTETTPFESKSLYKEKFVDDNTIENINYYNKRIVNKSFTIQDDTSILYLSFPNLDGNNIYANAIESKRYKDEDLYLYYSYKMKNNEGVFLEDYSAVETQYDDHKNLTKLVTYDNLRKLNRTITIEYKYDPIGNIIERLITYENGNRELRKSKFEYY